jgi:hypothetical protein
VIDSDARGFEERGAPRFGGVEVLRLAAGDDGRVIVTKFDLFWKQQPAGGKRRREDRDADASAEFEHSGSLPPLPCRAMVS